MDLKMALTTIFDEERNVWFSVPELAQKILANGFDGKIKHLNPSIHAACKRFAEKRHLDKAIGVDGFVYRFADLTTRIEAALEWGTGSELKEGEEE